ncbi:hypothetical protein MsAg5_02570 [Methanosarcinaceae archaeon Ag5]|uniref:Uncharacterized protein n=1 Tax=Methanolapillus africanus TaxID=3028297 RepID=A0AAE4SD60_9EURY|nr:hypothetical protein [Methanosarcinaceae archaeon Ag5]
MGLFNFETTPAKAVEMLGADNPAKVEKGIDFLVAGGADMVPFMVETFSKEVPMADKSKKHAQVAQHLYALLCKSEVPYQLSSEIVLTLVRKPATVSFDLSLLPRSMCEHSYTLLEETFRTGDVDTKKRTIPFLKMIRLQPSFLPILSPLLTRDSGIMEESLSLIPLVDGDLTPVSDALYGAMDVYPHGDAAMNAIIALKGRLPANVPMLNRFLDEVNTPLQKRAIYTTIALAEPEMVYSTGDEIGDEALYMLLERPILEDESARANTLELLEKKQQQGDQLSPKQLDLLWMILVNTDSNLTEERGMKFFGRIETSVRSLVFWYAQNGTQDEIICALKCTNYMKESGALICANLLPIYLGDDSLLLERAGYPAFKFIALVMKKHCGDEPLISALAKKMRDYCVMENLETPSEVMSILGTGDLSDVIEWSVKRIFESYGVGYDITYADEMLKGISDLVGFDKNVLNAFIRAVGFAYGYDSFENKPAPNNKEVVASINRLRTVNTPATSNFLHFISKKKDIMATCSDDEGNRISTIRLSFEDHRKLAQDELSRREFPGYSPQNYLKQKKY